jgi:hypothetical protein
MTFYEHNGYYGTNTSTKAPCPYGVNPAGKIVGLKDTITARSAGDIGEYLIQSRVYSARTNLSSGNVVNVTATALTLTAGIWDIAASVSVINNTNTITDFTQIAISKTSATMPGADTYALPTSGEYIGTMSIKCQDAAGLAVSHQIPTYQVIITESTIFYLVAKATWTTNTAQVWGSIWAIRRV